MFTACFSLLCVLYDCWLRKLSFDLGIFCHPVGIMVAALPTLKTVALNILRMVPVLRVIIIKIIILFKAPFRISKHAFKQAIIYHIHCIQISGGLPSGTDEL